MNSDPWVGVLLHATGGLAAASCYLPFRRILQWSWETYWLLCAFFGWIVAPSIMASLTVPEWTRVLTASSARELLPCYLFGALWGIGGFMFGLSVRYLGMSLGFALALGFCAALGTLIPAVVGGKLEELVTTPAGLCTLLGILFCFVGIGICGRSGMRKESELSDADKKVSVREFNLIKGVWVAVLAGVMSACFAFGLAAGKPIAARAVEFGTSPLWQNGPVLCVVLLGGFTVNLIWCGVLSVRNRSIADYFNREVPWLTGNYLFAALAGVIWFMQFLFYGMGSTQMGRYDFTSWSLHMAFIIIFSNIWGILLGEWTGTSLRTRVLILTGLVILGVSTVVIGLGNVLVSWSDQLGQTHLN